jgi:hypothetical protein
LMMARKLTMITVNPAGCRCAIQRSVVFVTMPYDADGPVKDEEFWRQMHGLLPRVDFRQVILHV